MPRLAGSFVQQESKAQSDTSRDKTTAYYSSHSKVNLNYISRFTSHRAIHTPRLAYKNRSVNAEWNNHLYFFLRKL